MSPGNKHKHGNDNIAQDICDPYTERESKHKQHRQALELCVFTMRRLMAPDNCQTWWQHHKIQQSINAQWNFTLKSLPLPKS